jgi:hypothetical protein
VDEGVADGEGVAAALADLALTADVPAVEDDVADDVCAVDALATARLPPRPTPSAPAPTATPTMLRPSLVFNTSASLRFADGPWAQGHPHWLWRFSGNTLSAI